MSPSTWTGATQEEVKRAKSVQKTSNINHRLVSPVRKSERIARTFSLDCGPTVGLVGQKRDNWRANPGDYSDCEEAPDHDFAYISPLTYFCQFYNMSEHVFFDDSFGIAVRRGKGVKRFPIQTARACAIAET